MAESLVELLAEQAARWPDRVALRYFTGGVESEQRTHGELARAATAISRRLRQQAEPGARALLLYPSGLEFMDAFLGCLAAGIVAVPCALPRVGRRTGTLEAVCAIAADCEPSMALTTAEFASALAADGGGVNGLADLVWLATDTVTESTHAERPAPRGDALAFLQYTSGSTSEPKGVMLTHRNLLANQRMLASPDGITAEDTYVSWVPLHHDMGLAIALQPVTVGATCVLMSPAEFVQRPRRWLEAIATQRGTVAGGPNFGFLHCLARIPREQRDGLDLSSWDIAFDGAEPVRAETLERFANGFASSGFRPEAPHPIYGLAEATCYVASKARGALPTILDLEAPALADGRIAPVRGTAGDRRRVVGCGAPSAGTELLVVDPEARQPCPPERVGEIWVRGPSVGLGYWRRPNETAGTFEARLSEPDQMAAAAYLRTGDLGFIRDGEVFITGRLKDLIIVNGSNHYPQDIEVTAENAHPSLRPAGSAAFALEGPTTERVGLVVEIDRSARGVDAREVVDTIRRAVAAEHQLVVATVALVRPGAIPRTTSGKVQRALCRARLAAGELARLD